MFRPKAPRQLLGISRLWPAGFRLGFIGSRVGGRSLIVAPKRDPAILNESALAAAGQKFAELCGRSAGELGSKLLEYVAPSQTAAINHAIRGLELIDFFGGKTASP